ncbi:MAG: ATP-dependent helicase [Polyangiaceae bacterium]
MSDESVRSALRQDDPLVVIEAPAGCGKTHQAADYACESVASGRFRRPLILTQTHAACAVFAGRTGSSGEIRTIDSLISQVGSIYHRGLGLPPDVGAWVREDSAKRYAQLAQKVASLLLRHRMIGAALAKRHGIVICDEHQDSTAEQHAIVMALHEQGARIRIFADPMQAIFRERASAAGSEWRDLLARADAFEQLDRPHRWATGCQQLGQWTLHAREALKAGRPVDLRGALPPSVSVVIAENQAHVRLEYQLSGTDRRPLDTLVQGAPSLLVLTRHNDTARSLRSFFNRRLPLWEGHVRNGLERLVRAVRGAQGNAEPVASAVVTFMGDIGVGFSPSAYGSRLQQEARDRCAKVARGKPALVQELARLLVEEPNHRGVGRMLRRFFERKEEGTAFEDVRLDHRQEFWDAIRLGEFDTVETGLAELARRRAYSRPTPPARAISTIHKAKGLECGSVIVVPCDKNTFPDKESARCLLYVALSRARERLMLVVSRAQPSPLLILPDST